MSSAGSPAWASSQSSTPRRPSGPTRRLPQRKSPCTVTRRPGRGPVRGQPARAELERGARLAQRIEQGQGIAERVGPGQAVDRPPGRWRGWRPGAPAHCAVSARAGRGPLGVAQDLARDGLALEPLDHQPGRRRGRRPRPWRRRAGTGTPARARPPRAGHARSRTLPGWVPTSPRSTWRMSGRGAPSPGDLEVERAGHPRGAPGEPAQVAHGAAEARTRAPPPARRRRVSRAHRVPLLDRDDRPPAVVELVQVLADAVAGARRPRRGRRRSSGPGPR